MLRYLCQAFSFSQHTLMVNHKLSQCSARVSLRYHYQAGLQPRVSGILCFTRCSACVFFCISANTRVCLYIFYSSSPFPFALIRQTRNILADPAADTGYLSRQQLFTGKYRKQSKTFCCQGFCSTLLTIYNSCNHPHLKPLDLNPFDYLQEGAPSCHYIF